MKWLLLAYCILSVNAAVCGVLVILVNVFTFRERTDEIWKRLWRWQGREQ